MDPSTEIRFCVRCGQALTQREAFGRLRPVCPNCGRVHFIDPKVAVAVLVESAGQLLLIQRAHPPARGQWSFPAGYVDGGENPARAAEREALEESGLVVRVSGLIDVFSKAADDEGADILIVYRANVTGGALAPGDDAAAAQFFSAANLPTELAFPSTQALARQWQTRQLQAQTDALGLG